MGSAPRLSRALPGGRALLLAAGVLLPTAGCGGAAPGPAAAPGGPAATEAPVPTAAGTGGPRALHVPRTRARDPGLDGLAWLAAHQAEDGRFPASGRARGGEEAAPTAGSPGPDDTTRDVGTTALALLAFLRQGYTNRGDHPFASTVARAARWLRQRQDVHGWILAEGASAEGALERLQHALATWALVEFHGMTESLVVLPASRRALAALAGLRGADGLWRYGLGSGVRDAALTFWALPSLLAAGQVDQHARERGRAAPYGVDGSALAPVAPWLEEVTDPDTGLVRPEHLGTRREPLPGDDPLALAASVLWARLALAPAEGGEPAAEVLPGGRPAAEDRPRALARAARHLLSALDAPAGAAPPALLARWRLRTALTLVADAALREEGAQRLDAPLVAVQLLQEPREQSDAPSPGGGSWPDDPDGRGLGGRAAATALAVGTLGQPVHPHDVYAGFRPLMR